MNPAALAFPVPSPITSTTCPAPVYAYYHQAPSIEVIPIATLPSTIYTNARSILIFQLQNFMVGQPDEETERIAAAQTWARSFTVAETLAISQIHLILYMEAHIQTTNEKHRSDLFLDLNWIPNRGRDQTGDAIVESYALTGNSRSETLLQVHVSSTNTRGYGFYLENIFDKIVESLNVKLRKKAEEGVRRPQDQLATISGAFAGTWMYLF